MTSRFLALVLVAAALCGCASTLDAQATAANAANVRDLVRENAAYTTADDSLPATLKATRAARNAEAVRLADNMAGAR